MEIRFVKEVQGDAIAVMASEGGVLTARGQDFDQKSGQAMTRAIAAAKFTGAAGQVLEIFAPQGLDAARLLVVGVGPLEKLEPIGIERWAGAAVRRVLTTCESLALVADAPGAAVAESAARAGTGARLAAYRFDKHRTKLKPEQKIALKTVSIVVDGAAAAQSRFEPLSHVTEGVVLARDLVSEPPNILYPATFAERIKELEKVGVEVEVLGRADLEKLGMGALLGVGQGSDRETMLVTMSYRGARAKGAPPLALVGKGVTFDTGGISLKPGAGMDEMKGDMGGAAAVVGAMRAIAGRKARANVVGIVGWSRICQTARRNAPATSSPRCPAKRSKCSIPTRKAVWCWLMRFGMRRKSLHRPQ